MQPVRMLKILSINMGRAIIATVTVKEVLGQTMFMFFKVNIHLFCETFPILHLCEVAQLVVHYLQMYCIE